MEARSTSPISVSEPPQESITLSGDSATRPTKKTRLKPGSIYHLVPASSALMEAADIGMSLYRSKISSRGILITGPFAAFICNYNFTDSPSTKNFYEFPTLYSVRIALINQ